MTRILFLFIFLSSSVGAFSRTVPAYVKVPGRTDTTISQRGWLIRGAYSKQELLQWGEIGFGRMVRLHHYDTDGTGITAAAADFTFGLEAGFGDSSLIYAPKLSVEGSCFLAGARVSYGYFMQDANRTGVIGIEGGLNVLSVCFVYAGYNFVKGNQENPVIHSGPRLSFGIAFPLGMKDIAPPKSSTHL